MLLPYEAGYENASGIQAVIKIRRLYIFSTIIANLHYYGKRYFIFNSGGLFRAHRDKPCAKANSLVQISPLTGAKNWMPK